MTRHSTAILGCAVCPPPGKMRQANVAAAFGRSMHLRLSTGYVTIGSNTLAAHPNSVLWSDFKPDLTVGQEVSITRHGLYIGSRQYRSFSGHALYTPSWRSAWVAAEKDIQAAIDASLLTAVSLEQRQGYQSLLRRAAGYELYQPVTEVEARMSRLFWEYACVTGKLLRSGAWSELARNAFKVAGLGSGLTPTGDDFLAGILATIRYYSLSICRTLLPHKTINLIARKAAAITQPFSAFLLNCAARGLIAAPLSAWLESILQGNRKRACREVRMCAAIGHSSGLDTLAGMLLAMQAFNGVQLWTEY